MWMTAFQASRSLPTITLASTISGLGQPPLSDGRHCQHSCEPKRQKTGGKYIKVRWRVRVTTEGEEETCFRCLSIDNSHKILGTCRTESRTIGLRGLFMYETNKEFEGSHPRCVDQLCNQKNVLNTWSEHNYILSHRLVHTTTCSGPVYWPSSGCIINLISSYTICEWVTLGISRSRLTVVGGMASGSPWTGVNIICQCLSVLF